MKEKLGNGVVSLAKAVQMFPIEIGVAELTFQPNYLVELVNAKVRENRHFKISDLSIEVFMSFIEDF